MAQSPDSRLRIAGVVLAAAGLLMVICSFFTWTSASDDGLSISVSGMGSVTLEASEERAQALGGEAAATAELDKRSKSPGFVTAALGLLLVGSSVMLVINRYPGIGAIAAAVLALIAVFMSLEYLFAPGAAVLDGTGDAGIGYAAVGLWCVTLGAVVAVVVSCVATVMALRSKPRPVVPPTPVAAAPRPVRRQPQPARYRDEDPAARRQNHSPRPEPGHRARPTHPTHPVDHLGRRPSQEPRQPPVGRDPRRSQAAWPAPASWQEPATRPTPRYQPDQRAFHDDSTARPPVRRTGPNPDRDRGLPPLRGRGPTPQPPVTRRQPPPPRPGGADDR